MVKLNYFSKKDERTTPVAAKQSEAFHYQL